MIQIRLRRLKELITMVLLSFFEELLKKKVESIAYTSSYLPAGDLNVIDFINENKKKD
jgi:hypothetical protein